MKSLIILLVCLALQACAATQEITRSQVDDGIYVILPGNFIIDLASGSRVELNPAFHTFIVFRTAAEARKELEDNFKDGFGWKIYELEGKYNEITSLCGDRHCLAESAKIIRWVD